MARSAVNPILIDRLRQGDEAAFEEIFRLCHRQLFHFAHTFCKEKELAQEIAQEAFVQLWVNREKLSPDLPLYPYLFTQVRRMTIDAFRKKMHAYKFQNEQQQLQAHLGVEETANTVAWRELQAIAEAAIRRLPEHQQSVFEMSRVQGLSYEEIAERLHISKNTVKYHLVNALKNLRKALGHYELSSILLFALPILLR